MYERNSEAHIPEVINPQIFPVEIETQAAEPPPRLRSRIDSIDLLRGIVMVIMMLVTEPSAVAPDPRVYFGDLVFKTEEITKTELRQPASEIR